MKRVEVRVPFAPVAMEGRPATCDSNSSYLVSGFGLGLTVLGVFSVLIGNLLAEIWGSSSLRW